MNRPSIHYMPQLDSLRAIAVFAVMIHHWVPGFLGFETLGDLGVRCFFVLSGFLITGILLRARAGVDAGRSTLGHQLTQFYIRRSLRIFPIYYLTLVVGVMLGMQLVRDTFWWHAAYGSNVYFALRGEWRGYVSHLWSLSVEEQFYLIWPILVLALPRRRLPVLFAGGIAIAIATRAGLAASLGAGHLAIKVLLPCTLDALVCGAVLAWFFSTRPGDAGPGRLPYRRWFPLVAVAFGGVVLLQNLGWGGAVLTVLGPLMEAIFFAGLIGYCAVGISGGVGWILNLPGLQYIGRISYGLYLYHLFAAYVATLFARKLGLTLPEEGPWRFSVLLGLSFTAAVLSHRFIEEPFNRLKRFFPPDGPSPQSGRPLGGAVLLGNVPNPTT